MTYNAPTMRTSRIIACAAAVGWLAVLPLAAQDGACTTPEIDVEQDLDELKAALRDRKMEQDDRAVLAIRRLAEAYDELDSGDQKKVLKAVAKTFTTGKLRPPETALYRATADALAAMSDAGARQLMRVHDGKRFPSKPEWLSTRAFLLRKLGETKTDLASDYLTERVAREHQDIELAAAGEALRHFAHVDERKRKEIVKAIVGKLGGLEASASQQAIPDPNSPQYLANAAAQRTLNAVKRPWIETLQALTGESFANGTQWQQWYNKNKSRRWDPPARSSK